MFARQGLFGGLLLALASFGLAAENTHENKAQKPEIKPPAIRVVSGNWGGAGRADLRKVCESASVDLWRAAGKPNLKPIDLSRSNASPITLYRRGKQGQYQVKINVNGLFWSQAAYQFSHELGHILCNYRPERVTNKWFEETICETASLYTLRQMGKSWQTEAPYPHWKSYHKALTQYAQKRIDQNQLPDGLTLGAFVAKHRRELDRNATNRKLNSVVAVQLLPLFEAEPNRWASVWHLNSGKPNSAPTLETYFGRWEATVPQEHKAWVAKIAKMLGIKPKSFPAAPEGVTGAAGKASVKDKK